MSRHRTDAELPVRIRRGGGPLPTQLAEQIRDLVAVGTLRPGDALPSTRALAIRLGVSRGSVTTAYDQLTVTPQRFAEQMAALVPDWSERPTWACGPSAMLDELTHAPTLAEFLTLPAYQRID